MRTIRLPTVPVLAVTTRCQDDWGRGVGIPTPWDTNSSGYLTPGYLPSVRDLGPETLILQKRPGTRAAYPLTPTPTPWVDTRLWKRHLPVNSLASGKVNHRKLDTTHIPLNVQKYHRMSSVISHQRATVFWPRLDCRWRHLCVWRTWRFSSLWGWDRAGTSWIGRGVVLYSVDRSLCI